MTTNAAATSPVPLVRRALIAAFVLYITFGIPDGVLGTVWPNLRDHFDRTDGAFGLVALCSSVGYAAGSLASGFIGRTVPLGTKVAVAMSTAVIAIFALAAAPTWWIALAGFAALGVGWGYTDAALNAWMAITQGPREMGLLHASYGLGAFLGPLLATAMVADGTGWRPPYVAVGVLTLGAVAFQTAVRSGFVLTPPATAGTELTTAAGDPSRLAGLMILWFGLYVGVEVSVGAWSFTLLTEGRGLSDVAAGIWTAAYWGGLMVGRLGLAAVGHRLLPERTLRRSTAAAAIAAALLWVDPAGLGPLGLPLLGGAFSVMFPVVMGRTPTYLGEDRAERSVGFQIAASALGFTTVPALIGVVADDHGVGWAAPIFLFVVIASGAVWLMIEHEAPAPVG